MSDLKTTIIFDMDGTLVDSSLVISNAINHVRNKLGLAKMPRDKILYAVNDMHTHSPRYFYEADAFTDDHIVWFQEYYTQNHKKEVALYAGILSLLDKVKGKYQLALATNAYRESTLQLLGFVDILHYFDIIVCADDVENSKPHADMIEKVLEHFEVAPDKAIMIGDSLKDKEAAAKAGVETILVDWGFSDLEDACREVADLEKLLGV